MPRTIVTEILVNCSVNGASEINELAKSLAAIGKAASRATSTNLNNMMTAMSKLSTIRGSKSFNQMAKDLDKFADAAKKAATGINSMKMDLGAMGITKVANAMKKADQESKKMSHSSGQASKAATILANAFMFLGSRSQFSLSQAGPMLFHMNKLGKLGMALIPIFVSLRAVIGVFRMVGNAVAWMGRQMVIGAKEVIAFKKELTTITAVANIPKIEFIKDENKTISTIDKIGTSVRAMATATGIASEDIVSSMQEVARAGIAEKLSGGGSKTDAISGMTDVLAKFQKGVGASAAEAQAIVIGTATMWQGEGENQIDTLEDLTRATDTWSVALNQTFLDADKLQTALQYSGNTFALLGTDIASTAAILGQFSQSGMKASKIGTASRAFGMALINPKQLDMLRQYGVELKGVMTDSEGKMFSDAPIRALEAIKASGLTGTAEGQGILNQIFGKVSGSSIAYLAEAANQVRALQQLSSQGYGKFLLAQNLESAAEQANRAREALKNLRAESGKLFESPIRSISEGIASSVQPVIDAFKKSMEERPQDIFKALDAGWKAFEAKGGGVIIAAFNTAKEIIGMGIALAFSTATEKLIQGIIGAFGVMVEILPRMLSFLLKSVGMRGMSSQLDKNIQGFDKFIFGSMKESVSMLFDQNQANMRTVIGNGLGSLVNLGGSQKERDTRFENNVKAEMGAADYEEFRSLVAKSKGEDLTPEEKMRQAELATAAKMVGDEMGMSSDEFESAMENMTGATDQAATSLEKFNYATTEAEAVQAANKKQQELMADSANAATMALAEIVNSGISTSFKDMKSLMDEITGKSSLQNTPIPEEFKGSYSRSKSYISSLGRSGQISAAEAEKAMQQLEQSFGQTPGEGEKRSRRRKLQTEINRLLDDLEETTDDNIRGNIQDKIDAAREQMQGINEGNESFSFKDLKTRFSKEGMRGLGGYLGETQSSIGKYLNQEAIGDVVKKDEEMQKQIADAYQGVIDKEVERVQEANKKKQQEALKSGYEGPVGGLESIPQFDTLLSSSENVSTGFQELGTSARELMDVFKNEVYAAKLGTSSRSMGSEGMAAMAQTPEVQQLASKMIEASAETIAQVASPTPPSGQGVYASGGRVSAAARMIDDVKGGLNIPPLPDAATGAKMASDARVKNAARSLMSGLGTVKEEEEKISNGLTDAQNKTLEMLNNQVDQHYNELQRLSKEAKSKTYMFGIIPGANADISADYRSTMPRRLEELNSKRKAIFELEKNMRSKNEWDKTVSGAFGMPVNQETGVDWSKLGGDPMSNLMGEVFGTTESATSDASRAAISNTSTSAKSPMSFDSLGQRYQGSMDYINKNVEAMNAAQRRKEATATVGAMYDAPEIMPSGRRAHTPGMMMDHQSVAGSVTKMAGAYENWGKGSNVTINHGVISNYNVKDKAEKQAEPWAMETVGI